MAEQPSPPVEERPEITRAPVTGFVIGWVAGVISALLGVGGGILMVPAMSFMLRIRPHRAVGTSLAVIVPTAVAGVLRYHTEAVERGLSGIDFWAVLWLALGGVFGARFGANLANALNARQLRRAFGVFVILVGMWMIIRAFAVLPAGAASSAAQDVVQALQMIGVGIVTGIISGLLGVGGGLVTVPVLVLLLGYGQHVAQGTSLAVIIPVSVSGAFIHVRRGNVIWSLAVWLALGAVLGAWFMAGRVYEIDQPTLRTLFGIFLIVMGVTMAGSKKPQAAPPSAATRE
jgi:uncharacterized membrane protein YfcA